MPTINQNVSFICDTTGYPRPDTTWYFKRFDDAEEIRLDSIEPELELDNITKSSSGYYYCQVNNTYGTIRSKPASLNVLKTSLLNYAPTRLNYQLYAPYAPTRLRAYAP